MSIYHRWQQESPVDEAPWDSPAAAGGAKDPLRDAGVGLLRQVPVGAGVVAEEAEGHRGGE